MPRTVSVNYIIGGGHIVLKELNANKRWFSIGALLIAVAMLASATQFYRVEHDAQDAAAKAASTFVSPFDWFDSFYFTVINFTTVGFGDITPKTTAGRWLAMGNSLLGLISFGGLVAMVTAALQPSQAAETDILKALNDALQNIQARDGERREGDDRKHSRIRVIIETLD